jgi:hypothetical protein
MLDARQALRQCAGFACLARSLLLRVGLAGCQSFFNGLDLGLRFGDGRLQIFQRQFQLRGVQLLGFRPKLGAPIILNLAFQLLDQLFQLGDECLFLGDHSLLVLAGCALDRGLKFCMLQRLLLRREGLHYLGRKVWKLAKIEGLRHELSYQITAGKPNKTTPETTR